MSTLQSYTSGTRPSASSNSGLCIFRSDTNNIEVSDGTDWLAYASDGITFGDNSYVAQLDGTDDYLALGDVSGTLGGASKCTISCWIKKPNSSNTQARWWMGAGNNDNLLMLWDNGNTRWFIGVGTGTGYGGVQVSTSSILDDTWYLWTVVYDGTQSTELNRLKLYKNATALSGVKGTSTVIPTSLHSTAGDAPIVGAYPPDTGPLSAFSDASYDDFAIFDDALTASQISNIYNNQIYPSSLKHLYRMENNVNDSVGNANGSVPNQVTWQTLNLPY